MNIIGILSGRFQPPHRGHLQLYNYVKDVVGRDNAYVATSDKIDPVKSPLSFHEKQQIWTRHGVPVDKVVKVANPYKSAEITHKFNPKQTAAIFFLSEKDAQRIPFAPKNGQPSYFQPYKGNENNTQPIEQHAYIAIVPTFKIDGRNISGTTVREGLGSLKYSEPQKRKFFQWVFGWFDIALFEMLVDKFTEAEKNKTSTTAKINEGNEKLKKLLRGIIRELTFPDPSGEVKPGDSKAERGAADAKKAALDDDPEVQRAEREKNRAELAATQKQLQFQDMQKKYRVKGVEQDKRDIEATRKKMKDLRLDI